MKPAAAELALDPAITGSSGADVTLGRNSLPFDGFGKITWDEIYELLEQPSDLEEGAKIPLPTEEHVLGVTNGLARRLVSEAAGGGAANVADGVAWYSETDAPIRLTSTLPQGDAHTNELTEEITRQLEAAGVKFDPAKYEGYHTVSNILEPPGIDADRIVIYNTPDIQTASPLETALINGDIDANSMGGSGWPEALEKITDRAIRMRETAQTGAKGEYFVTLGGDQWRGLKDGQEGASEAVTRAFTHADFVIMNTSEATKWLRHKVKKITPGDTLQKVAYQARDSGIQNGVITDGINGSAVFTQGGLYVEMPAHLLPGRKEKVHTLGTGDGLKAGFISARRRGMDVIGSLAFASVAAADITTRPDARSGRQPFADTLQRSESLTPRAIVFDKSWQMPATRRS